MRGQDRAWGGWGIGWPRKQGHPGVASMSPPGTPSLVMGHPRAKLMNGGAGGTLQTLGPLW